MRKIAVVPVVLLLVLAASPSQARRRRPSTAAATSGPYSEPPVTFYGTVKYISKKEISIDLDSEKQSLTLRCSGKTKFSRNGRQIKAAGIPAGAHVAVDAILAPDAELEALHVMVKPALKPAPK
jgi:hypothetical protein